MSNNETLRVISGKYRSRKIKFLAVNDLRPSSDRVRETVFNWLQFYIENSVCLDLFTGSGILSIEAISRGAKKVIAIEKNKKAFSQLIQNRDQLTIKKEELEIKNIDAIDYLENIDNKNNKFDLIFLDPPYNSNFLLTSLKLIIKNKILKNTGLIFCESDKKLEEIFDLNQEIFSKIEIVKIKKMGRVYFYLLEVVYE